MMWSLVFTLLHADLPLEPSDARPLVFRIPAQDVSAPPLAELEVCFGTLASVNIAETGAYGRTALLVRLNETGTKALAEATIANVGKTAQLVYEGEVVISPQIMEPLLGGAFEVTGLETIARAEQLRQAALGQCSDWKTDTQ